MIDFYTFWTPNGHKVGILLEELEIPYKTHVIDISKGDQFKPEFVKINPNSKIPAIHDTETGITVFESIAAMIYLAEKHGRFLPAKGAARYQTLQWCLFQAAGVGPMFGQLGHFKVFAQEKIPYAIERYSKESNRLLDILNNQLKENQYLAGSEYSIADMATWPWLHGYQTFYKESFEETRPALTRWYREVEARPKVQKGIQGPK